LTIQVDEQQAERVAIARSVRDRLVEQFGQPPAVEQPGEAVAVGKLLRVRLAPLEHFDFAQQPCIDGTKRRDFGERLWGDG
jgi:hypothetical protein